MEKIRAKITDENIFLFVYGLCFLIMNISITYLKDTFDYVSVRLFIYGIVYAYYLWYLMNLKENKKDALVKILIFVVIGALVYYFSNVEYIFPLVCLIVCSRNVDYKKIFKIYIVIAILVMIVVISVSSAGLIQNRVTGGERIRSSLGYNYYSYASHIAFFVSISYIAIRKKVTLIELGILGIFNYIIYKFTDTKVPLYAMFIVILLCLFLKGIDKIGKLKTIEHSKLICTFITISPFLFLIFSYLIHMLYNPDSQVWIKLNDWLNTRLALGHAAVLNIPQTLFGQEIIWNNWAQPLGFGNYFFVDNSFINIMLQQGLLYMFMILIGYSFALRRAFQWGNWGVILAIIGCMILGLADPELAWPSFQPIILLTGWMLCSKDQREMEKDKGGIYSESICDSAGL